ncbi:MAG: hypothetical protein HWD63_11335 [Candidatus Parvibacillus calidus]|nr:MAG: hypothetical protein HWD63_11335 [Candidatus Parvibacillus calidus]
MNIVKQQMLMFELAPKGNPEISFDMSDKKDLNVGFKLTKCKRFEVANQVAE